MVGVKCISSKKLEINRFPKYSVRLALGTQYINHLFSRNLSKQGFNKVNGQFTFKGMGRLRRQERAGILLNKLISMCTILPSRVLSFYL